MQVYGCFNAFFSPPRKEKDLLEEKIRNSNLEKEQELIERIIKDSGGKLTKRSANTQVSGQELPKFKKT